MKIPDQMYTKKSVRLIGFFCDHIPRGIIEYPIVLLKRDENGGAGMVFTYGVSVVLLSFAMFGCLCFLKDLWSWIIQPCFYRIPKISFLVVIKDIEQDIEEMLRHLIQEIEIAELECDVVVVDVGSVDLTYAIAQRLAGEFHPIIALQATEESTAVMQAMPHCKGAVVHVIDTIHRSTPAEFVPMICWLIKETSKKIVFRAP